MIHGLPNGFTAKQIGHPSVDWTNGCIAVTDAQIEEIWRLVDDGTALVGFRGDGERAQVTSASIKEPSNAFPRLRAL